MLFLINVVISVATFWNAAEDHAKALSDFRSAQGSERPKTLRKFILLWLIPVLSIAAIPLTWHEQTESEIKIADAKKDAGEAIRQAEILRGRSVSNELAVAMLTSNNLVLEKQVLRLKNPSKITVEQRRMFLAILSEAHNVSKVPIDVIVGGNERETEQFAFQLRKVLSEAGYGETPSEYHFPTAKMDDGTLFITNVFPNAMDLRPFEWGKEAIAKIRGLEVTPMPTKNIVVPSFTIGGNPKSALLGSKTVFTSSEPNVIALFSGTIPNRGIIPSVMAMHPDENNPSRATHYMYSKTSDPNAILYGVCEALYEIGITVGVSTTTNLLPLGRVAFFIPNQ
jgi:hypothetical protein